MKWKFPDLSKLAATLFSGEERRKRGIWLEQSNSIFQIFNALQSDTKLSMASFMENKAGKTKPSYVDRVGLMLEFCETPEGIADPVTLSLSRILSVHHAQIQRSLESIGGTVDFMALPYEQPDFIKWRADELKKRGSDNSPSP